MSASLVPLAAGVYAWLGDDASHDHTNIGVVIAADGLTVVDSGPAPSRSAPLAHELAELTDLPIRRLVYSASHVDQVGGSSSFPLAAVYGSGQTSHHLDQPPAPDVWKALHPALASDYDEISTRPVSHTITEAAHLCPASIAVPLGGFQFENLVVQVPAASVVFAGALASFGTIPLGFEADFPAWIDSLEQIRPLGELIVPGHGPIGGAEDVAVLQDYLAACLAANGDAANMAAGPWDAWANQQFTPINVERAARLAAGDPSPPPSLLQLLGRA